MGSEKETNENALLRSENLGLAKRSAGLVGRGLESLRTPEPRILRFPVDRTMGDLFLCDTNRNAEEQTEAQGEIVVHNARWLLLRTHAHGPDLSPLGGFGPNDIQELDCSARYLDDTELRYIQGLTGLKALNLELATATNLGLSYIQDLTGLEFLNLGCTQVTDSGLACIKHMTSLRHLDLWLTRACDLSYLTALTQLEYLSLKYTDVTDAALANIRHLGSLRFLHLGGTGITDEGLLHLHGLRALQELVIRGTNVKDDGIATLKEVLPDCIIR